MEEEFNISQDLGLAIMGHAASKSSKEELLESDDSDRDSNYITAESESPSSEGDDVVTNGKRPRKNKASRSTEDPLQSARDDDSPGVDEKRDKRSRWNQRDPSKWKYNIAKQRRSQGLPYKIKNKGRDAKTPRNINCQRCRFKCSESISEEERQSLCAAYWKLADFKRQKDYLLASITFRTPERRRKRTENGSRLPRQNSKQYYFVKGDVSIRVCQLFFLKTLCISNDVVLNAFMRRGETGSYVGEDKRGKCTPGNKTKPDIVAYVKQHIESFPTVKSHYTRQSTKRQYLDKNLSISKMYDLYKREYGSMGKEIASLVTYRRIFGKEYNLFFFRPKKDLCQLCENYFRAKQHEKLQLQESYDNHLQRKRDCNKAKDLDKERAKTESHFLSVTFDLQSVLQIPSSDVSPMYYSRKICAYNLTVYESAPPNNAFCYCWTEMNGKRGSSEIGSCLYQYLTSLPTQVTEVSLFSDTCGGQNRNKHVAAILLYLVQSTHIQIIEHKFLESGHTYMEVDSMHSAIEKAKRYVPVYTMQDWLSIFRIARSNRQNKNSSPYSIKELKYLDFHDLQHLSKILISNTTKDEDGQKVNWLQIKSLRYSKANSRKIEYKYQHDSDYKVINVSKRGRPPVLPKSLKPLYTELIPISIKKKDDLMKLCRIGAIPEEFHGWYHCLPTSPGVTDTTAEPSIEDSLDEEENEK